MASYLRADMWLRRGELAEAEAEATSAIEAVPTLLGFHPALFTLGEIYIDRGDLPRAASHLDNPEQGEENPGVWEWSYVRGRRGILRAAQGRLAEALDDLLTAGSWFGALGVINPAYLPWRSEAGLVLTRLGRREEALRLVHEEVKLARTWGAPRALGRALCSAGLVVGGDEGVGLLREAVEVLSDSPQSSSAPAPPPSSARRCAAETTAQKRGSCWQSDSSSPSAAERRLCSSAHVRSSSRPARGHAARGAPASTR
jgi:tetratricopeptide (TPR) repeat protein